MSFWENIKADFIGIAIVLIVLFALCLIIKLIVIAFERMRLKKDRALNTQDEQKAPSDQQAASKAAQYAQGKLKLIRVDEKTAALIMAIVSDKSDIPLSELNFKSIRLMN